MHRRVPAMSPHAMNVPPAVASLQLRQDGPQAAGQVRGGPCLHVRGLEPKPLKHRLQHALAVGVWVHGRLGEPAGQGKSAVVIAHLCFALSTPAFPAVRKRPACPPHGSPASLT